MYVGSVRASVFATTAVGWICVFVACGRFGSSSGGDAEVSILPGGDFETSDGTCGDWSFVRGIGTRTSPGHTGSAACRVCDTSGILQSLDLYIHPRTFAIARAEPSTYRATAWVRTQSGKVDVARTYVQFTGTDGGVAVHEPSDGPTVADAWEKVSVDYVATGEESNLIPGLRIRVEPKTCADVDDFTLTAAH